MERCLREEEEKEEIMVENRRWRGEYGKRTDVKDGEKKTGTHGNFVIG